MNKRKTLTSICVGLILFVPAVAFVVYSQSTCNVAYIKVHGVMMTYGAGVQDPQTGLVSDGTASEDVTRAISHAEMNPTIKAIVVEFDSSGGSPVAGEEIEESLKEAQKPTVALIRDQGDSAAYLAASGANTIIASEFSFVGDIGVTSSYVDQAAKDTKDGKTYNSVSVGTYKDMMNPDKPLTPAEKTLMMQKLQQAYNHFVQIVSDNRHLPLDTTTALANGSPYTGSEALANGLIDKVGNIETARMFLEQQLHLRATICSIDE